MKTVTYDWSVLSKYKTVLYGIAALSIIVYHFSSIFTYFPDYTRPTWATCYYGLIGSTGVEIFVFLAGVFCYFSYKKSSDFKEYIKKKIIKIFPPYIIIGLAFWGTEYIFLKKGSSFEFFQDFSFVSFFTKGENRFWFVLAILVFYCIYPLICKILFSSDKSFLKIMLLVSGVTVFIFGIKDTILYSHVQIALTRVPIFLIGCFYGKKVFDKGKVNIIEIIIAIIGIVLKLSAFFLKIGQPLFLRMTSALFAFSSCLLVCLLLNKIEKRTGYKYPIMSFFGTRSLELYLLNVAIIKICIDLGILIIGHKMYLFAFLLCVAIAYVMPKLEMLFIKGVNTIVNSARIEWFIFAGVLLIRIIANLDLQTITVPSDEFNTVSAAAQIMGNDWGNAIAMNGYYGYTAIITYLPVYLLQRVIKDSYWLYQIILLINSIVCSLYTLFAYKILDRGGKGNITKKAVAALALLASFVPQFWGIGQMAQNESTYALNHILVIYILVMCCDCQNKVKKFLLGVLGALFAVMAFAGNNRGVVIMIAIVLGSLIINIIAKKNIMSISGIFLGLISGMILHYKVFYPYFRSYFPKETYNTDANIIFERIPRILMNWQDMKAIIVACFGWLYSFITSTYGVGIIIIGFLMVYIISFKKFLHILSLKEHLICIIMVLWLVGTTILCTVNFLDSIQGILQYNPDIVYKPERVDKLFYFRYYIALAPFAIVYGVVMVKKYVGEIQKKHIVFIGYFAVGIILFFHSYIAVYINGMLYAPSSTNLIGLFLQNWTDNYKYGTVNAGRFLILTSLAIVVVSLFVYCMHKKKLSEWIVGVTLLEIVTCIGYSGMYMAPRTQVWKAYMNEEIIKLAVNSDETEIYVQNNMYTFLYQFAMPEKVVYASFDNQSMLILENGIFENEGLYGDYEKIYEDDKNSLWVVK